MARRPKPPAKPRITVQLTGTVAKQAAHLDSDAILSIEYAQLWHQRHGSLKVPSSGIVRRALQVYIHHLAQSGRDEVKATERACKVLTRPSEEHQLALLRLHEADPAQALPPFEVVRDGAQAVAERRAMHERLNAL